MLAAAPSGPRLPDAAREQRTGDGHRHRADPGAPADRVPGRRARGLTGWWRAKPCSHDGIVWMGTNALEGYGRKLIRNVMPCAPSGERAMIPIAAANHDIASTNSARIAIASSHCPTSAPEW